MGPASLGATMRTVTAVLCALAAAGAARAQGVDAAAAEALMKKSNCFKCHSVTKKKDGPAYQDVAAKYQGRADAEATLVAHLTTRPKIKIDGNEEPHDSLNTKNDAEIRGVVTWILTR